MLAHRNKPLGKPIAAILPAAAGATQLTGAALATKNRGAILVDGSVTPIRGAKGRIVGSVLVFRDLTARDDAGEAQLSPAAIVELRGNRVVLDRTIISFNSPQLSTSVSPFPRLLPQPCKTTPNTAARLIHNSQPTAPAFEHAATLSNT